MPELPSKSYENSNLLSLVPILCRGRKLIERKIKFIGRQHSLFFYSGGKKSMYRKNCKAQKRKNHSENKIEHKQTRDILEARKGPGI
jgi:hypothetical protein